MCSSELKNKGIYIPSIDAKDIYLSSNIFDVDIKTKELSLLEGVTPDLRLL